MATFTFTRIVILIFLAYVCNAIYVIYHLFTTPKCNSKCITPAFNTSEFGKLKISLYVSRSNDGKTSDMKLAWDSGTTSVTSSFDESINITLPASTRRNGSMFGYVFVHPMDVSPFSMLYKKSTFQMHELTQYAIPKHKSFNLIGGSKENTSDIPIVHMHSKLSIYLAIYDEPLGRYSIPGDIHQLIKVNNDGVYMPILYIDKLTTMSRNLLPIEKDTRKLPMQLSFKPVSLGRLRIWSSVEQTLGKMKDYGFTENDLDDIKGIFTDTNLYFLAMTFTVALFHTLFDVLAFKNDVSFWRNKSSMEGMSIRSVVWRCVSTTIIFLYLLDEKTSLLVLVPAGVGTVIEFWKVTKALKIKIEWKTTFPNVQFGTKSKSELETNEIDEQAMRYLSYALYPLLIAGAIYSLIYQPHKSWYSWLVRSLVNGVYAFGFLFMLPQLFLNYKLKSVAHLPWRAFMYKAFNTFIDDIFAFIIVMPTAHRLACFRDDAVFLVYLYQKWLYPVDKSRTNEFGMVFDDSAKKDISENETDNEKKNK
ncbi:lipid scramblase CLPTM1L [Hydra vulgaris]|nr:cleft lip and palate transmembrane protein 1-like protein [Hydra vulgaris]